MMVKDSYSEARHPNQNPAEALGVKPLKQGADMIMNRTGAPPNEWPWAHKYIADINNHCSTPVLNYKTPISVRHGYTPDISPFLQYQFREKVYYKVDEAHPNPKEAAGYWMGISHNIGDALTYVVRSEQTGRFLDCSVLCPADPKHNGIPNLRVPFTEVDSGEVNAVSSPNLNQDSGEDDTSGEITMPTPQPIQH